MGKGQLWLRVHRERQCLDNQHDAESARVEETELPSKLT
jgi:hypothetical protein